MYTPEEVYHISLYNDYYVKYSILTESYDQELLNKPSYMFLPSLGHKILPEQSKCSKHLTGFLRHCMFIMSFTQLSDFQRHNSILFLRYPEYCNYNTCHGHY